MSFNQYKYTAAGVITNQSSYPSINYNPSLDSNHKLMNPGTSYQYKYGSFRIYNNKATYTGLNFTLELTGNWSSYTTRIGYTNSSSTSASCTEVTFQRFATSSKTTYSFSVPKGYSYIWVTFYWSSGTSSNSVTGGLRDCWINLQSVTTDSYWGSLGTVSTYFSGRHVKSKWNFLTSNYADGYSITGTKPTLQSNYTYRYGVTCVEAPSGVTDADFQNLELYLDGNQTNNANLTLRTSSGLPSQTSTNLYTPTITATYDSASNKTKITFSTSGSSGMSWYISLGYYKSNGTSSNSAVMYLKSLNPVLYLCSPTSGWVKSIMTRNADNTRSYEYFDYKRANGAWN